MSSALGALEEFDKYSYQHGNANERGNCALSNGGSCGIKQVERRNFWSINLANGWLLT
jgi:hypothetical protein